MSKEIERKFLVTNIPNHPSFETLSTTSIYQYYLATSDHEEVRLHMTTIPDCPPMYQLTVKFGTGLIRDEFESEVSESIYRQLLAGRNLTPLTKIRKRLRDIETGYIYDIDIYDESLCILLNRDSLIVAEVEFPSEEEARAYQTANWLDQELTGTKQYSNRVLFEMLQGFR